MAEERPAKRFKYESYSKQIAHLRVDRGREVRRGAWDAEGEDEGEEDDAQMITPLTTALEDLSLIHLCTPYAAFTARLTPLSRTLPLTLLNARTIQAHFHGFFARTEKSATTESSGLDGVLVLFEAFVQTLQGEAVPFAQEASLDFLRIGALQGLQAVLIEKTYSALGAVLRILVGPLVALEPHTRAHALQDLWEAFARYLDKGRKGYVRACVAEVWSVVLRRTRGETARLLVRIMLRPTVEDAQDGAKERRETDPLALAAVFSEAMKGAPGLLHSRAMGMFTDVLREWLWPAAAVPTPTGSPSAESSHGAIATQAHTTLGLGQTIDHLTISLVHHCTPEGLRGVHELALELLRAAGAPGGKSKFGVMGPAQTVCAMHLVGTLMGARKGQRVPPAGTTSGGKSASLLQGYMTALVALLPQLEQTSEDGSEVDADAWTNEFLRASVACLLGGKLADWIQGGKALIDGFWAGAPIVLQVRLVRMLVELQWKGIEQFILAHVAKTCSTSLDSRPAECTALLACLATAGYLDGGLDNVQAGRWRAGLAQALAGLLDDIAGDASAVIGGRNMERVEILRNITRTLPSLASSAKTFVPALQRINKAIHDHAQSVKADKARETFLETPYSAGALLSWTLGCLGQLKERGADVKPALEGFDAIKVLDKWGWHRSVVQTLASLGDSVLPASDPGSLQKLCHLLGPALASEDHVLRANAARLLAIVQQPALKTLDGQAVSGRSCHLFELCVEVEESGMSLRNVRERATKIKAIGLALAAVDFSDEQNKWLLDALVVFLIAQLKVNFRPLYPDTISVLTELAQRSPDAIWQHVFDEVEKCLPLQSANLAIVGRPSWSAVNSDDVPPETVEDGDKGFICPNATRLDHATRDAGVEEEDLTATQLSADRLDVPNYETQLLLVLGNIASVTEKHARQLVPLLLSLGPQASEEEDAAEGEKVSTRMLHAQLHRYLQVFAKFNNPKALYRAREVENLVLSTLSVGDPSLQGIALQCVLTYKSPAVSPYGDRLQNLLQENKFRDQLAQFALGINTGDIDPAHRLELMPVTTRLLYGIMTSRRGRSSSNQGPTARRNAILSALAGLATEDFATLVDLMLSPFETSGSGRNTAQASSKQKVGFLSLLGDVLRHLGPQLLAYWDRLLATALDLTEEAQTILGKAPVASDLPDDEAEDGDETKAPSVRQLRALGVRRLVEFFRAPVDFNFDSYIKQIFSSIVQPRLDLLAQENSQAPSAIVELLVTWANGSRTMDYLVKHDPRVLPSLFSVLAAPKVKPVVSSRVMDAVESIVGTAEGTDESARHVKLDILQPHVSYLLASLVDPLRNASQTTMAGRDALFRRQIVILAKIAPFVQDSEQAKVLVDLLLPCLRRPGKQVSEQIKTNMLQALQSTLPLVPDLAESETDSFRNTYNLTSLLFRSLHTRQARQSLCQLFAVLVQSAPELVSLADLIADLNAFSRKRVEEPDFERRLKAYARLLDELSTNLSAAQWMPVLQNMLFYVQDNEEFSIRSNAGAVLRRFVEIAATKQEQDLDQLLLSAVFPAVRNVLDSRHEAVRLEGMGVLATMVSSCGRLAVFSELQPLLAGGDEEASFFTNVYHIQTHRRTRALRRLGDFVEEGVVRESTLVGVFLPVVQHYIRKAADGGDHHLTNEAVTTFGRIVKQLTWSKYLATLLQMLRQARLKGAGQRYCIRALTSCLEAFHFSMNDAVPDTQLPADTTEDADVDGAADTPDMSPNSKVRDYVVQKLLPTLNQFLELKDEADAIIRIPVVLGIVKIAMALPEDVRGTEISRILTIVSHVLRSKDQDTRDLVKDTLCKTARVLGPMWLGQLLRDLRAALQRGPQLHVLAVVTHAILVHVTTEAAAEFSNLDNAVGDIVHIAAEVIWGESGKDAATEGFKSKMREVKSASSRAYDTFQITARLVSPTRISHILSPLRSIMRETAAVQPMQQVDEVLRRIATGLNGNPSLGPMELLRLCHTLAGATAEFLKPAKIEAKEAQAAADFRVQMKRKDATSVDHSSENVHRFVAFGLDLFVTAFRRGKFDFGDAQVLSRLAPMVPIVGNALYSTSTLVQGLALRATAAIVKCPIPSIGRSISTFVKQIFAILKKVGGAESELGQTAFKSLAVVVRDCKEAELTNEQLTALLALIGPDLEETDRQAALFALLRAILSRRFVVPEVYDLMDRVSSIMVTSQSAHVQELCRSTLIQFLLDYPQGKGRLTTQMQFLAQNLSYVYESGRISVMELLSAVFNKFSEALVREYADLFFLALVMVAVNDDAEKCRTMAGILLKQLLAHYDEVRLAALLDTLSKWTANAGSNPALARAAMIVDGLLVQSVAIPAETTLRIASQANSIIRKFAADLRKLEAEEADPSPFAADIELDFALPYQALLTASQCLATDASSASGISWTDVSALLLFPHDWVRLAAARAIHQLLTLSPAADGIAPDHKRFGTTDSLLELAKKCCILLSSRVVKGQPRHVPSQALCSQVAKILFIAAQKFADHESDAPPAVEAETDEEDGPADLDAKSKKSPLSWLMSRLSFVARNLIISRPSAQEQIRSLTKWTPPLLAILQLFAGISDTLSGPSGEDEPDADQNKADDKAVKPLLKYLPHMLSPLYRILDDDGDVRMVNGDTELENLRALAIEVREHVQTQAGMTAFSRVWEDLRKRTVAKRGGRRREKDDLAMADPEAFARHKERRGDMKRDNKKRKSKSYADAKIRERPTKRRA